MVPRTNKDRKVAIVPPDQGTAYTGKGAVAKAKEVFNKHLNVRRVDTVASSHAGTLIHDRLIADRRLKLARKWPWNTAR